jgi:hypothetical protein
MSDRLLLRDDACMKVKAYLVLLAFAILVLAVGGWTVNGIRRVFGARRPKLAYAAVSVFVLAGMLVSA